MKSIVLSALFFASFCNGLKAQAPYVADKDPKHPEETILTGILSKYTLMNREEYRWFITNRNGYTPETRLINTLDSAKGKISLVIFGGTWCDDTRYILPKFFAWQEKTGFPDQSVSFFGVDRDKKIPGHITSAFNILNVPTIIVMKEGKEIGRVVEYGKTGKWDAELADIIRTGL